MWAEEMNWCGCADFLSRENPAHKTPNTNSDIMQINGDIKRGARSEAKQ